MFRGTARSRHAALMPIVVATISASSDAVFFSTASASKFFIVSQSSGTRYRPSAALPTCPGPSMAGAFPSVAAMNN